MAVAVRVPLERLADPTDTTYIPRPDWYFLFLFQMLKFFEGPLEIVGAVILPSVAILALLLVPFLDRGRIRRWTERTAAFGVVALALLGWTGLTAAAIRSTPKPATAEIDFAEPTDWMQLSPEELAGIGYYRRENCAACHSVESGKPGVGPNLPSSHRKSAAWMIEHFKHPSSMVPGSAMPSIQLTNAQLNALAAFLLKLTPRNAEALQSAPDFVVEGAVVYQANACSSCHAVNGVGVKMGPALNGLSRRRTRTWVERHFVEPQVMSPGTVMPVYKFSPQDMQNITSYLFSLPD
jgi:mono/diheme cytochrome c family protein